MTWQEEVPKTSGWFWIWPHNSDRAYVGHLDVVIDYVEDTAIKMIVIRSPHGGKTDLALLPSQVHKWAGPIQNPPN